MGIEVGAYDLIGWSRNPDNRVPGTDAIAADGHSAGEGACWASRWADFLADQVDFLANATGLSMIETDGPYAGYTCEGDIAADRECRCCRLLLLVDCPSPCRRPVGDPMCSPFQALPIRARWETPHSGN